MSEFASLLRATARFFAGMCTVLGVAAVLATSAHAQTCNANLCTIPLTSNIYVDNNDWGNCGCGVQSISVNSPTSWSTTWGWGGTQDWMIRSYAAAILGWQWGYVDSGTGFPVQLSAHTPINTSVSYTVSTTGTPWLDVSYDMWYHTTNNAGTSNPAAEMMIWLANYGGLSQSGTPNTVTIDGINWDVYFYGGPPPTKVLAQFVVHGATTWDLHGANLNISDFNDYLVGIGYYNGSWWCDSVQFGTEVYNYGNGTLNVTNYTASVGGGGGSAPPAPTGLTATAGNAQVALSWNASSGATAYDVKRSTVNGSGYTTVSSPTSTNYTNTGLTNGTTYYFVVDAKNAIGTSGNSNQASATPTSGGTSGLVKINAGGPAVSPFVADADFSGGSTATNWTGAIDTSAVSSPAPQAVYQSERFGAMTYTIGGLTSGTTYTTRLHFCENYFTASTLRKFNVAINGTTVLSNFDIFATTGAIHKANVQQFNAAANGGGQIVIVFTNVTNNALVNGIEVNASGGGIPPAPTGLTASPGNAQVSLTWNASSGATSYSVYRGTSAGGEGTVAIATGISLTNYNNTGLTNGTRYYFTVKATNASGTSGASNEANAIPTASQTPVVQINSGGSAAAPFIADADFGTGTKTYSVTNAITTTGVTNPAPQAVYQTERASDGSNGGAFTYTLPGLTANAAYTVRLHFAEIFYNTAGNRAMNVTINGTQVLTSYDIFTAAGGQFKAVVPQFPTNANGSGQIVIVFGGGGAKVDGIEVLH